MTTLNECFISIAAYKRADVSPGDTSSHFHIKVLLPTRGSAPCVSPLCSGMRPEVRPRAAIGSRPESLLSALLRSIQIFF